MQCRADFGVGAALRDGGDDLPLAFGQRAQPGSRPMTARARPGRELALKAGGLMAYSAEVCKDRIGKTVLLPQE
ncbi:hypothetical protein [Amycolatopsis sp. cmx-4-54]|uniref:hypothetical protein n=1 Tax=Amycolatopsis sp. cmx-4-54 TaxID=2790936 RepID=UPI00397E8F86